MNDTPLPDDHQSSGADISAKMTVDPDTFLTTLTMRTDHVVVTMVFGPDALPEELGAMVDNFQPIADEIFQKANEKFKKGWA